MTILDDLCGLWGQRRRLLSKEEQILLDGLLLEVLCEELTKLYYEGAAMVVNKSVINLLLLDLIESEDYTIGGIAAYAQLPEEVVYDIAIGNNTNPTLAVSRKIIKLHMGARTGLYQRVMQKITEHYAHEQVDSKSKMQG